MCVGLSAKVVKISEGTAVVDAGGAKREVSAQLLEDLLHLLGVDGVDPRQPVKGELLVAEVLAGRQEAAVLFCARHIGTIPGNPSDSVRPAEAPTAPA